MQESNQLKMNFHLKNHYQIYTIKIIKYLLLNQVGKDQHFDKVNMDQVIKKRV